MGLYCLPAGSRVISNARLPNKKLVPNFALRGMIVQWKEAHPV